MFFFRIGRKITVKGIVTSRERRRVAGGPRRREEGFSEVGQKRRKELRRKPF